MSLRVGDKIFALFVKIFCSRSCSSALCQAPRRKRRNLPGFLTLTCCKYFNLSSLLSSYLLCKFTAAAFPLYGLFGLFRLNSGFLILNIFQISSNIFLQFGGASDDTVRHQHDREAAEEGGGEPEEDAELEQRRGQSRGGGRQPQQGVPQEGDRGPGVQGQLRHGHHSCRQHAAEEVNRYRV